MGTEVGCAIENGKNANVTGPLHGSKNLGLLPPRNKVSEVEELADIAAVNREWLKKPLLNPYPDEVVDYVDHDNGPVEPAVVVEDRAAIIFKLPDNQLPPDVTYKLDQMEFPK